MAGIVSFHAHPDDETIVTGGLLARAAAAGHRVTLVFATRGELGTPVEGVLADGEQLSLRRTAECYDSAAALGVARVEFLGWTDSGMAGDDTNDVPWCFWQADVDHAAVRLAAVLAEEQPDVLTIYDDIGGYGHPDHVQVHRVGVRAAALAGVPIVAQATINRDRMDEAIARAAEFGVDLDDPSTADAAGKVAGDEALDEVRPAEGPELPELPDEDEAPFGKRLPQLTHRVDVTGVLDAKRASMRAHASQIGPDHFMSSMSDAAFAFVFGDEWFIVDDLPAEPPALFTDLFVPIHG
ncbi:MAG: PIG-L family deacetylase [Actinobacteria bacterium]|nr:PIG-L family deacetylase [Actinomycetota bacterium]